jgi:hypothetical protein
LSDAKLLILGPALDPQETERSLACLGAIALPNAVKIVVTRGKYDAGTAAKTFNIDSGYPAEIALLQTLATWAGRDHRSDPCFRDGYDLFCIRRLLDRNAGFAQLLLMRDCAGVEQQWPEMLARAADDLFAVSAGDGRNLLVNLADPRSGALLDLVWSLYRSGAAYAIEPYSLGAAMGIAREALDAVA